MGFSWILENLKSALYALPGILLALSVHECAHGYTAYLLGDPTAKNAGRLTLNPIRHFDPLGLIMLLIARFGWAKPVPINPSYFKHPKGGMVLTALAGPLSNLLLAFFSYNWYCLWMLYGGNLPHGLFTVVGKILVPLITVNVGLAVFNLIPIPPLDGSKVLGALLPLSWYGRFLRFEQYGAILLFVLIIDPFNMFHFSSFLSKISGFILDKMLALIACYLPLGI